MGEKGERTQTTHYMELGSYQYWPVLVPRGIRLYTYEQIPAFLRENPYITDGYRAYLPSKLCIKRSAPPQSSQIPPHTPPVTASPILYTLPQQPIRSLYTHPQLRLIKPLTKDTPPPCPLHSVMIEHV